MSDHKSNTVRVCPECESEEDWGGASWCPSCGFYPAIRKQVEQQTPEEEEVVYDHWWEAVPAWLWPFLAGVGCLFIMSAAVRILFAESLVRSWWTFGQMGVGLIAVGTAHFMAYMYGVSRSDKLGPLDMLMRPLATWQPVFAGLPDSSNLVCCAGWGLAAIALAFFVIDGVDYVAIMQADATARKRAQMEQAAKDEAEGKKKTSAMGAMIGAATGIAQAKDAITGADGAASSDNLGDALTGFAGEGAVGIDGSDPGGMGMADLAGSDGGLSEAGGLNSDTFNSQQQGTVGGAATAAQDDTSRIGSDGSPSNASTSKGQTAGGPHSGSSTSGGATSGRTTPSAPGTSPVSAQLTSSLPVLRDEVECLILGYTTNATGEIRSLLLAAAPERRVLRFVAKVPVEQVDPNVLAVLMQALGDMPARRPLVRCPFGGRWVRPELFCIATYDGWTADNRLYNAEVARLVIGTETH